MACTRLFITGLCLLLAVKVAVTASAVGPYCAVCDDEKGIEHCKSFIHCRPDQKCYLQVFKHHDHGERYYGGCADNQTCNSNSRFPHKRGSDLLTDKNQETNKDQQHFKCGGCCDGNECNLHLCGTPKSTVVACALCDGEHSIRDCNHLVECPDQECYLQVYSNTNKRSSHHHHVKIFGGCATANECRSHHLGARDVFKDNEELDYHSKDGYHLTCGSCCSNGTICNVELCDQKKYFSLPTHSTTTTTTSATKMTTHPHHQHNVTHTTQAAAFTKVMTTVTVTPGTDTMTMKIATPGGPSTTNATQTAKMAHTTQAPTHMKVMTTDVVTPATGTAATTSVLGGLSTTKTTQMTKAAYTTINTTTDSVSASSSGSSATNTTQVTKTAYSMQETIQTMVNATDSVSARTVAHTAQTSTHTTVNTPKDSVSLKTDTTTIKTTAAGGATTTNTPTTQMPKIQCHQCSGVLCGLIADGPAQECPVPGSFCFNTLVIDNAGQRSVTKRCGSLKECQTKWWLETSDSSACTSYNPLAFYPKGKPMTCHYCCTTSGCNSDIKPPDATLFDGHKN